MTIPPSLISPEATEWTGPGIHSHDCDCEFCDPEPCPNACDCPACSPEKHPRGCPCLDCEDEPETYWKYAPPR